MNTQWFKRIIEQEGERIYEIIAEEDGYGFGVVLVELGDSRLHFHEKATEFYFVLEGSIAVTTQKAVHQLVRVPVQSKVLTKGEGLVITPLTLHEATSLDIRRSKILVFSIPPWTPKDHIVAKRQR